MARPRKDKTPSTAPNKQRLSHFAVKNLQPRERPYTVWDVVQRGLAIVSSRVEARHGRPSIPTMGARAGFILLT
jgi:hypothetical protein